MDLEWIKIGLSFGAALLGGFVTAIGAFYALRGEINLVKQRLTTLENMENTAVELRLTRIEEKLKDEKFQAHWEWKATVDNRLDRLEK